MNALQIVGGILLILASILMIVIVLMQDSKGGGVSAMTGRSDSYLSKNKSKTLEAKLSRITKILFVIFFAFVVVMNLIIAYVK